MIYGDKATLKVGGETIVHLEVDPCVFTVKDSDPLKDIAEVKRLMDEQPRTSHPDNIFFYSRASYLETLKNLAIDQGAFEKYCAGQGVKIVFSQEPHIKGDLPLTADGELKFPDRDVAKEIEVALRYGDDWTDDSIIAMRHALDAKAIREPILLDDPYAKTDPVDLSPWFGVDLAVGVSMAATSIALDPPSGMQYAREFILSMPKGVRRKLRKYNQWVAETHREKQVW